TLHEPARALALRQRVAQQADRPRQVFALLAVVVEERQALRLRPPVEALVDAQDEVGRLGPRAGQDERIAADEYGHIGAPGPAPVRIDEQVLAGPKPEDSDRIRVLASREYDRVVPRGLVQLDGGQRHEVHARGEGHSPVRPQPQRPVAFAVQRYDVLVEGRTGHAGALYPLRMAAMLPPRPAAPHSRCEGGCRAPTVGAGGSARRPAAPHVPARSIMISGAA